MSHSNSAVPLRTALGRVKGLGSAKGGTSHWWLQRVTSIGLLPLTIWFAISAASLAGAPYPVVAVWIGHPVHAVLLLAMIGLSFHHTAAGLQVVIEDYVRPESRRMAAILVVKAICLLLALTAALAVLRLAVALAVFRMAS